MAESLLNIRNHDRDASGMTYVYPVISRRADGVSVGINLNPNNACNWHCAYCQVPDLVRGSAPDIDMELLERELSGMLEAIVNGSFMSERVPEGCRVLRDVAISGNGEPTSCRNFDAIVALIIEVMQSFELSDEVKMRLITNGSYLQKPAVQRGLKLMSAHRGEVWVKVDSSTEEGIERINGVSATPELLFRQVKAAAECCPTWLQSCMFLWDSAEPSDIEIDAYLQFIRRIKAESVPVRGVLIYGLARQSQQPEAERLKPVSEVWIRNLAGQIERAGLAVKLSL